MKQFIKLTAIVGLLTIIVGVEESSVFAATTGNTEGSVTFGTTTAIDPIKPGTEGEKITPEDGSNIEGALRADYLPNIRFGSVDISTQTKDYASLWSTYTDGEGNSGLQIPAYAQVTDVRGTTGQWELTVTAKAFTTGVESEKLANSMIQLYGSTVTNNVADYTLPTATTDSVVSGFPTAPTTTAPVSLTLDTAVSVMKVKAGQSSNASVTSNIFKSNYSETDYGYNKTPATVKNEDVKLHVPSGEKPLAKAYTAVLTWNLIDSI